MKQSIVWTVLTIVLLVFLMQPEPMAAQKRAAMIPPAGTWLLDFELHGDPQKISMILPGETQARTYWYLLYTVTNDTGDDVNFYPKVELFTDTFKLHRAGKNVRRMVFAAIKERYATTIPLLERQQNITGKLLTGEDNARDSVAIFEDFDPKARSINVFVSGLSNEIVRVKSPLKVDQDSDQTAESLLRRTLKLNYKVPGDKLNPNERVILYQDRSWVLR
ncbi:MAG: hypothetical protein GY869_12940 [Planctomycetes bacterium]|nr:hypothetical protein [Planctomycetota bacterium]